MTIRVITSSQHPLIKKAVQLRLEKEARNEEKHVVVSGKKLITDLSLFWPIETLFYTQNLSPSFPAKEYIELSEPLLKKVSGVQHSDGLAAIVPLPPPSNLLSFERILLLDGIQDPGNLGALYRSAAAFDWQAIGLLPETVDPFNDKALRAARGTTFSLPYGYLEAQDVVNWVKEKKGDLLIAHTKGKPPESYPVSPSIALMLSNEGKGPSSEWIDKGLPISIPMSPLIESLNVAVAGSILLYSLRSR